MLNSLDSRSSRKTSSVRSSTDTPRNSQRDSSPVVPAQKRKVSYHTSSNENFKVVIRARPPLARELNGDRPFQNIVEVDADEQVITVSENLAALATGSPHNSATLAEKGPYSTHIFTFDYVYDQNASQEKVYATTAKSVVDSSLEGYNATIFAYGQTGTGKTYTMEGYQSDQDIQHRGLIPRAIEQIFGHIQRNASPRMRFLVRASYLQIYNEVISDLLKPERNNLAIREDPRRGVFVEGLSEWVVRSPAEIYGLMERGATVRATGATNMNEASSRSHAVFIIIAEQSSTFYVDQSGNEINFEEFTEMMNKQSNRGDAMKKMDDHVRQTFKVGKLNLVDLAGSERVRLSGATGVRLTESRKINQSLSALGNVIAALTDVKGRQHIPYRDSKLTRILEDSLGGNCKTTMMAMISPALESMVETVSTLKFANRAKNIKNEPKVNEDLDQKSLLRKYERELRRLRAELDERSRNVVDKRRLLELDEQRRRAERDKMAAIRALEQRSLEFLREKEEKRKLEERILMLTSQIRMGGNDKASEGDSDQLTLLMKAEQERIRHEYEARLQEIEKERETIEEEKAQVDRYKQLLLKQRDIMIALTQRLNERDEQIMALQDEVDAYDRHNRELEEKLDAKTAQLIHLQRVTLEAAATSPVKNSNLDLALGAWAEEDGPRCPTPQESAGFQELDFHSVSAPGPPVSPHMLITFPQFQRYQPESFMVEGHEASLPGDADLLNAQDKIQELTGIISQYRSEMERMVKDNEDVKAEKVSMEFLLREKLEQLVQSEIEARLSEFRKEQSSMDTPALQKVVENQRNQLKLKHDEVQSLAQQLEFERNQLKQLKVQLSGAEPKGENKELINLQERCEILSNERRALHSILDQKIRVLVEGVGVYFKDLDPVENSIAAQAKNSFKNLRRIVEASVNALREAETADKKRIAQDTLAAQTKLSQTAIMTSSSKVDETAPIGKLPTSFSEDFHPEK